MILKVKEVEVLTEVIIFTLVTPINVNSSIKKDGEPLIKLTNQDEVYMHRSLVDRDELWGKQPVGNLLDISKLHLDVSKPKYLAGQLIKPSRIWLTDIPFSEVSKPINK